MDSVKKQTKISTKDENNVQDKIHAKRNECVIDRFLPIDRYNRYQSNQIYRFLSIDYSPFITVQCKREGMRRGGSILLSFFKALKRVGLLNFILYTKRTRKMNVQSC